MQIEIPDPKFQTLIFILALFVTLLISLAKRKNIDFDHSVTQELKGLAILAIIFGHIGYFLSTSRDFLHPLSVASGMGVNLFLFLSGYGLTLSYLKNKPSILDFYKKRLFRLFLPMWITITLLICFDFIFLNKTYPLVSIFHHYLGISLEPNELFSGLDSPLWYFTLILIYYLVFPLVTFSWLIYLSPLILLLGFNFLLNQPSNLETTLISLYKIHSVAFPAGVAIALLASKTNQKYFSAIKKFFSKNIIRIPLTLILIPPFCYFAINSSVDGNPFAEQLISLILMFLCISFFLLKNFQLKFLNLYGKYSYGIYLIHWPILFRYGVVYKYLPAALSTYLYLLIFLFFGFILEEKFNK